MQTRLFGLSNLRSPRRARSRRALIRSAAVAMVVSLTQENSAHKPFPRRERPNGRWARIGGGVAKRAMQGLQALSGGPGPAWAGRPTRGPSPVRRMGQQRLPAGLPAPASRAHRPTLEDGCGPDGDPPQQSSRARQYPRN
jgi:hypothetical protein